MRSRLLLTVYCLLLTAYCLLAPAKTHAHEPLWGETASTVGDRVFHPDLRLHIQPSHRMLNGRASAGNPTGLSLSRVEQRTAIDYGIGPKWNARIEIPVQNLSLRQTIGGAPVRARFTELGDMIVGGKYRFYIKSSAGKKTGQAISFGLRLPTGRTSVRDSTGAPLPADMQPGSGSPGTVLGYVFTHETTKNSIWASLFWEQWLRRNRFTRGDGIDLDASYGHWLHFPESIPDLGTMLTAGIHLHWHDNNRLPAGRDPNSGDSFFGLHTTFIAQKDQNQLRFGVLFPIRRGVNGVQPADRIQFRFGIERFF